MTVPTPTIGSLLTNLTREPGRPRITWYGPDGERIELSGAVLQNWVNKTANLLVEEFDAGPGTRVLLDLPGHWRTAVWAFAVWRVGACVVLEPPAAAHPDVVVTDSPQAHPDADELVVVSLPALARRYDGTLPPGALDAAAAVMTYGDRLGWVQATDPDASALESSAVLVRHADLCAGVRADATPPRPRALIAVGVGGIPVAPQLTQILATLAADGSVVLVHEFTTEPGAAERLRAAERITVWPPR